VSDHGFSIPLKAAQQAAVLTFVRCRRALRCYVLSDQDCQDIADILSVFIGFATEEYEPVLAQFRERVLANTLHDDDREHLALIFEGAEAIILEDGQQAEGD